MMGFCGGVLDRRGRMGRAAERLVGARGMRWFVSNLEIGGEVISPVCLSWWFWDGKSGRLCLRRYTYDLE